MFRSFRLNSAKLRLLEEKLYEQVASELQQGYLLSGLWTKALSISKGDEQLAKSKYTELRVQSLKDENAIAQDSAIRGGRRNTVNQQQLMDWHVKCDVNDPQTIKLIEIAKKKKANHNQLRSLCSLMGLEAEGKVGLFKDSWFIKDDKGNSTRYNDSDELEAFLVEMYDLIVERER